MLLCRGVIQATVVVKVLGNPMLHALYLACCCNCTAVLQLGCAATFVWVHHVLSSCAQPCLVHQWCSSQVHPVVPGCKPVSTACSPLYMPYHIVSEAQYLAYSTILLREGEASSGECVQYRTSYLWKNKQPATDRLGVSPNHHLLCLRCAWF